MDSAFHFLDVLVYGTVALVTVTGIFAIGVSCLPKDNELRAALAGVVRHLGVTATWRSYPYQ
jgi:hypothetical protein